MAGDFVVILRPRPGSDVPPPRRLARVLKYAGKRRLKCVHFAEVDPGDVGRIIAGLNSLKRRP